VKHLHYSTKLKR